MLEECEAAATPLTVVEFAAGAVGLLAGHVANMPKIEEVVVVGAGKSPLPAGASAWGNSCRTAANFLTLWRSLIRAGRPRVAIVAVAPAVTQQLRLLQLFSALPSATLLLVVDAPTPPVGGPQQKAVYRASRSQQLTTGMLPRAGPARTCAWHAFLATALRDVGATVCCELGGTRDESVVSDGCASSAPQPCQLLKARRAARAIDLSDASCGSGAQEKWFFGVVLSQTDQLELLKSEVDEVVRALPPTELQMSRSATAGPLDSDSSTKMWLPQMRPKDELVASPPALPRRLSARLVPSTHARYVEGGYSIHHYVPQPPGPHASAYELEVLQSDDDSFTTQSESVTRVGYIALQAYGVATPERLFPTAVAYRTLHACQVERLVVLPHWRGCGTKEALLAACQPYVRMGYPVRIKTGSERVHQSFMACRLLSYEGHRPPGTTSCGVRRPMKRYARILAPEAPPSPEMPSLDAHPSNGGRLTPPDHRLYHRDWRGVFDGDEGDVARERDAVSACSPDSTIGGANDATGAGATAGKECDAVASGDKERLNDVRADSEGNGTHGAATGFASERAGVFHATACSTVAERPRKHLVAPAATFVGAPRALINKLTTENMERLVPQLMASVLADARALQPMITLLMLRAAREPIFTSLYATVIARLDALTQQQQQQPQHIPAAAALVNAPACLDMGVVVTEAPRLSSAACHQAVEAGLLETFAVCEKSPEYSGGAGRLAAELVCRRLMEPSPTLTDAMCSGPISRLCAFCARCGPELSRRYPRVLQELVCAVRAAASSHVAPRGTARSAACAAVLEMERLGWPANEEVGHDLPLTLAEARREAASDLGLVLAPRDAPPERLRGLREGWVHWYVAEPTRHPDDKGGSFNFDERQGKFVRVERYDAPIDLSDSLSALCQRE